MSRYLNLRVALWLLLVLGLNGVLCWPCYSSDYAVYVVEPAVTNHMVLQDGQLPPVCKKSKTIKMRACRGEYEPASFVITSNRKLENVKIEVGMLRGPGGVWPEDAVDVRMLKDYYSSNLITSGRTTMPLLLVHDESILNIEPDPTAEAQIKMKNVARGELRDAATIQPVTIDKRKQFWITVHVPENIRPGTYKAPIRIIPKNDSSSQLTLEILVYSFKLLSPMIEYSIYYPTYLAAPGVKPERFGEVTADQMRLEFQNMLAHGLSNPNIYQGPEKRKDGSLDYTTLSRILELRESVGMRSKSLYLVTHPITFTDRPLTPVERSETHRCVREINAWAKTRGYEEVYYAACDEWWGEQLSKERDSMIAVHEAGGKVFVACMHPNDFYERVGDLLDLPVIQAMGTEHMEFAAKKYNSAEVLRHLPELAKAGSFRRMQESEEYRRSIDGVHRQGRKIYTYMNPIAGLPMPDYQRRSEGLGLWRVGFEGTMTWSYIHIQGDPVDQSLFFAKAYRTENGVLDTIYWEGYREGVDDIRYLTTLLDTLSRVRGRFPDNALVRETDVWISKFDAANGDLDAIRREIARRVIALSDLGHKDVPAGKLLAGIKTASVRIVQFPEPWRFKMDPNNLGVKNRWFASSIDDSKWGSMRTDTKDKGWGSDVGSGWYRTRLPIAFKTISSKKFRYLYFSACDEDSWIYLNGKLIREHSYRTTGLLPSKIWMTPFSVPIEGVALKGSDVLAVRVYSSGGMGGIWKPVYLIESAQALNVKQIEALMQKHSAK